MIFHRFTFSIMLFCIPLVISFPESSKLSTVKKLSSKSVSGRSFENCYSKGTLYHHGANLTRSDDPCERCFCYKGTILCWNINCPQSLDRKGCKEIHVKNLCCPILECPLAAKEAVYKDITGRQPRKASIESSSPPITLEAAVPKNVTCKYGHERYKPGQRVTINPLKPCQRCSCGAEGKVKCEFTSTCKDSSKENKKQSSTTAATEESTIQNKEITQVSSSFSTRTIPDAILKRVQNLLHKAATQNLTSVNPNELS